MDNCVHPKSHQGPLFSIVTVTLNSGKALLDTLNSVMSQSFRDFEYIIKDGGSSDGSVKAVANSPSVHVVQQNDEGIYDAMNQALGLCQGQFVYFLNAGDTFYDSDVLGKTASNLTEETAILYGELLLMPQNRVTHLPPNLSRFYLFKKNLNHQAWMTKREVYLALNGFDSRYRFNADQHFLRRAIFEHEVSTQHINVILTKWSYGGFSTCRANRRFVRKERWRMLQEFYSPLETIVYSVASLYFLNPLKSILADLWNRTIYKNV
jgi:glycosyltransferase involved in cell wall biosynthesis